MNTHSVVVYALTIHLGVSTICPTRFKRYVLCLNLDPEFTLSIGFDSHEVREWAHVFCHCTNIDQSREKYVHLDFQHFVGASAGTSYGDSVSKIAYLRPDLDIAVR